jgi:polyphosphate kinase
VEILTPVEDLGLREELRFFLDAQSADRRGGWEMRADGSYRKRVPNDPDDRGGSQQTMASWAADRLREATRLKRRKAR